ncbi:hypothetical protein HYFRA_00012990 [Hymenoscyphus fraxineus]|uniref:Uncharacterized protein n=1 Tax=Hymenoscyphus fraxineus TaxID=746836 RepID=A0A9N9L8Y8_9HELO|nr:hypothetical protein HYFRA_00012990 [Hymenoscyphus fraxineus]
MRVLHTAQLCLPSICQTRPRNESICPLVSLCWYGWGLVTVYNAYLMASRTQQKTTSHSKILGTKSEPLGSNQPSGLHHLFCSSIFQHLSCSYYQIFSGLIYIDPLELLLSIAGEAAFESPPLITRLNSAPLEEREIFSFESELSFFHTANGQVDTMPRTYPQFKAMQDSAVLEVCCAQQTDELHTESTESSIFTTDGSRHNVNDLRIFTISSAKHHWMTANFCRKGNQARGLSNTPHLSTATSPGNDGSETTNLEVPMHQIPV